MISALCNLQEELRAKSGAWGALGSSSELQWGSGTDGVALIALPRAPSAKSPDYAMRVTYGRVRQQRKREHIHIPLQLFHIPPAFGEQLFIAASDADRAAGIFAGIAIGAGWELGPFAR